MMNILFLTLRIIKLTRYAYDGKYVEWVHSYLLITRVLDFLIEFCGTVLYYYIDK